jgi:hypothetical protein
LGIHPQDGISQIRLHVKEGKKKKLRMLYFCDLQEGIVQLCPKKILILKFSNFGIFFPKIFWMNCTRLFSWCHVANFHQRQKNLNSDLELLLSYIFIMKMLKFANN